MPPRSVTNWPGVATRFSTYRTPWPSPRWARYSSCDSTSAAYCAASGMCFTSSTWSKSIISSWCMPTRVPPAGAAMWPASWPALPWSPRYTGASRCMPRARPFMPSVFGRWRCAKISPARSSTIWEWIRPSYRCCATASRPTSSSPCRLRTTPSRWSPS